MRNLRWRERVIGSLAALALLDTFLLLYVFVFGGVALRIGGAVLRIGNTKLSCNKLLTPFLVLLVLLLLMLILRRPDPLGRFTRWCREHRRTILRSLIVCALAAVPRLWDLTGHSLNPDELLWMDSGQALVYHVRAHEFKKATSALGHPGIVPAAMIGASYVYLGDGASPLSFNILDPIAAMRMPIAAAGIATCLILYLLGRLVLGEGVSFWAAVFLCLYPEHIASSRVAQLDAVLALFFLLTLLCYLISAARGRLRWKIASGIFFGLALLTKTPASLLPVILVAWKGCARLLDRRGALRFWEASDLGWLGIGLGLYFSLFTRLWYEPQELPWAQFLHEIPRAEMVIGLINRIGSFPWLEIAGGLLCAGVLLRLLRGRGRGGMIHPLLRGALLALACLSFVQIFRKPMVNEMLHYTAISHFADAGHMKYWMGRVVIKPPPWFYLFMLLVRTPPLMLCLLAFGIVRSCMKVCRGRDDGGSRLMCLFEPLLVIAAMSMGAKMGFRYIVPAIPFLCVLSAVGFTDTVNYLAAYMGRMGVRLPMGAAVVPAVMLVSACSIVPLARIAPAYDMYFNVFIGGLPGAARSISIGFGVGTKEAAEYLRDHARKGDSIYALGISGELAYYLRHMMPPRGGGLRVNEARPPDIDWLVVPLSYRVRFDEADRLLKGYPFRHVYAVSRYGLDLVDIYRHERNPVSRGE